MGITRRVLTVAAFAVAVSGVAVASTGAPATDLQYVTAAVGDTYDSLSAGSSCDGPALAAANGNTPIVAGLIVLVPPVCQGPAPTSTTSTTTTSTTTMAMPTTTAPPSVDPTVTFNPVPYAVPEKRAATSRGEIGFSVACPYSHSATDDPIVHPGMPGMSHLHDFFGARNVNAATTITNLQQMPTTCGTGNDRSAYWAPAFYVNGRKITPGNVTFYYKPGVDPRTSVRPIPFGLQMIAGNAMATTMQDPFRLWFQDGNTASVNTSSGVMPAKPQLRITFPDCWDGRRLTSPDQSHMAYHNGNRTCPASHPVPILQLTMFVQYTGGGTVTLASGSWITLHADFFNAWHPDTLRRLIAECVVPSVRCGKVRDT